MKITTSLKRNHEFKRLYNKGKNATSHLVVVYCKRNGSQQNRLGITVSTKLGGAVVRNRIRRRLREIYRTNEHVMKSGYDIVLVARIRSKNCTYKELEKSVLTTLHKLGITQTLAEQ